MGSVVVMGIMPMSDTCHAVEYKSAGNASGFTLLEILVVLLLGGLIAAVAMPGLTGMVGSIQRSVDRAAIGSAINGLPYAIRERGEPVVLSALPSEHAPDAFDELQEVLIEAGASLVPAEGIFFSASGFCPFGGEIVIHLNETERSGLMVPPECRIDW